MNTVTMSNAALAVAAIVDAERALTHYDLRVLAQHLCDRLGVCDAETLGGMLAPDLVREAPTSAPAATTDAVEPTLDDRVRTIIAHIRAATTLQELRACANEIDAGRRAGFTPVTSGRLYTEISKQEQGVLQALLYVAPEAPVEVTEDQPSEVIP